MRNRSVVIMVVGVVLAVLGSGIAVAYVKGNDSGGSSGPTRAVVVSTAAVAAGTPVADARLEVRRLAESAVPANAVTSLAALTGQVALVSLGANQVVTPSLFGVQGVAASGGVVLPTGKKGIGVQLGFAPGVLRYVVPGNRIDVMASFRTGNGVARTRVLLRNIEVIATTPGAGNGAPTSAQAGPGNLDFLLAVDEAQAQKIVNAQAAGESLYLTLASTRKGA